MTATAPPAPPRQVTADDFALEYDRAHRFSFFETDGSVIVGYGHADPGLFATEVRTYDQLTSDIAPDNLESCRAADVDHLWAP